MTWINKNKIIDNIHDGRYFFHYREYDGRVILTKCINNEFYYYNYGKEIYSKPFELCYLIPDFDKWINKIDDNEIRGEKMSILFRSKNRNEIGYSFIYPFSDIFDDLLSSDNKKVHISDINLYYIKPKPPTARQIKIANLI